VTRLEEATFETWRDQAAARHREWGYDPASIDDHAERDARATLERLGESWRRMVPRRFIDAHVDQLDGALAAALEEWRSDWRRNLLIVGPVGVGKSHAAIAAARLVHFNGLRVVVTSVVDLLDGARPSGFDDRSNSPLRGAGPGAWLDDGAPVRTRVTLDDAANADLLVLDDLGAERPTDWTGERLGLLVDVRWREARPTIATSNLAARDGKGPLVDAVGQRVYSRLVHDAVTVAATGPDRRRQPR
jgi:DNA replication protein DnaC